MWNLAAALAEVLLRRRGPESLPDSGFLVAVLLVIDFGLSSAVLSLGSGFGGWDLLLLIVDMALYFAYIFAILSFFKLERRYWRTMTALLGADIWIMLLYIPLALLALGLGFNLDEAPFDWLQIALLLWLIYISAWVLARSLSQSLIVGLMFEILYLCTWLSIGDFLGFPAVSLSSTST